MTVECSFTRCFLKARGVCCLYFHAFAHVFLVTLLTFLSQQLNKNTTTFTSLDAHTGFFLARAAKHWNSISEKCICWREVVFVIRRRVKLSNHVSKIAVTNWFSGYVFVVIFNFKFCLG